MKARRFRLVPRLNIILLLRQTSQESTNLVRKCCLVNSSEAGHLERNYCGGRHRAGKVGRVQKSLVERLNAKEVITPKGAEQFILPIADETAKLSGRDEGVPESTLRRDQPVMGEDLREVIQGNSERSQLTETKDDAEARNDFWSIEGDFIYRHHVEPRVQLYVPKEETCPIPLKYTNVTRDVLQERCTDDYWNVDVDRHLSDSWTGCTKFTVLNEKPPKGYVWSREEAYEKSSNYQT